MLITILGYFLVFVEVISSILLIGVILIQKSKGQGLGMGFGQAMGESFLGAQAGNILTKTTVVLATIFFVNTILIARMRTSSTDESLMDKYPNVAPVVVPSEPPLTTGQPFGGAQPAAPMESSETPTLNLPTELPEATQPAAAPEANSAPIAPAADAPAVPAETPAAAPAE